MRPLDSDNATDASLAPKPRRVHGHAGKLALARWTDLRSSADLSTLLWLLPLIIAAVYLVIFVVQLPRNLTELEWNSDYVSGFVIPETVVHTGTGGDTVISAASLWVPLWFGLATAKLPLHRELWQISPTALFFITALIVGWSVAQLANRRAALLAVLLAVIASPRALVFFMVCAHNVLYPCTALMGAYLIWLVRGGGRRKTTAWIVPLLAGVVLGTCVASEVLVISACLVPLALTAVLAGLRSERRSRIVSLSALTSVVVAVPVALATNAIMFSLGFNHIEIPSRLVPLSALGERAELLFDGLQLLFNGYLDGPIGVGRLHYELGVASEVVMSAALLTLIVMAVRSAFKLLVSAWRKKGMDDPTQLARSLHIVYWVVSAACAGGAFWLSGDTGGGIALHESYYATIIFSVAAVVPLALSASSFARQLILVGASIFFAASIVGMTGNYLNISQRITDMGPAVTRLAAANGVNYGYGGYWNGSAFTWNTPVAVRPLMECENPAGANICPFYDSRVPSWYVPQNRHTFLLVDQEEPLLSRLPEGLGQPLKQYQFGTTTMYIYSYDIASRLGPPVRF